MRPGQPRLLFRKTPRFARRFVCVRSAVYRFFSGNARITPGHAFPRNCRARPRRGLRYRARGAGERFSASRLEQSLVHQSGLTGRRGGFLMESRRRGESEGFERSFSGRVRHTFFGVVENSLVGGIAFSGQAASARTPRPPHRRHPPLSGGQEKPKPPVKRK